MIFFYLLIAVLAIPTGAVIAAISSGKNRTPFGDNRIYRRSHFWRRSTTAHASIRRFRVFQHPSDAIWVPISISD